MRFEAVIKQIPEVIECDAVGGGIDYVLKLVTRDVNHYQRLIEELLSKDIGVETYFTYVVTKRIEDSAALPLAALVNESAAETNARK